MCCGKKRRVRSNKISRKGAEFAKKTVSRGHLEAAQPAKVYITHADYRKLERVSAYRVLAQRNTKILGELCVGCAPN